MSVKRRIFIFFIILLLIAAAVIYYYYIKPAKPIAKAVPDTIRLASWNIRIFSNDSRDDDELKLICQNIIDYDLIALIELRDEAILQRTEAMLKTMGKDYEHQISDEVGRGVKERYALLYDVSKVEVINPGRIFPDPDDYFIREPYYASFRSGEFDFTIVVTHIIWGDSVRARREEILKLADVYEQIQETDPSEQDIILVGDFNREPDDEKSFEKLKAIPSMAFLFDLPQKTIIEDTNLYDNIWFQSDYVREYNGTNGIDKFDETDFGNNDAAARMAISDHRPVWAEFSTRRQDDD